MAGETSLAVSSTSSGNFTFDCSSESYTVIYENYSQAKTAEKYYYLALLLVASVFNVALLTVTLRFGEKHMRQRTVYPKMALIAIADLVTVTSTVMRNLDHVFSVQYDVDMAAATYSAVFCKLPSYLYYAADCISSWLMVALAVERFISIKWPFAIANYQSKRFQRLSLLFIVFGSLLFVAPLLLTADEIQLSNDIVLCYTQQAGTGSISFDLVYNAINILVAIIVPTALLLVFSVLLILQVRKATYRAIGFQRNCFRNSTELTTSFQHAARSRYLRLTIAILTMAIVYAVLQIPDIVMFMAIRIFFDPTTRTCEYLELSTSLIYTAMVCDLVVLTDPLIFLMSRWVANREPQRTSTDSAKFSHNVLRNSNSAPIAVISYSSRESTRVHSSSDSPIIH